MKESEYYEMVYSLYSAPSIMYVSGNVHRSDFLYVDDRTGIPTLYRWDAGVTHVITPGDEPVASFAELHRENSCFVFARDTGSGKDHALYLFDYSTREMTRITRTPMGVLKRFFWASDESWIVEGSNQKEYYIQIVYGDGSTESLFTSDERIVGCVYDDTRALLAAVVGNGPGSKIAVIDSTGSVSWISESDTSEDAYPHVYCEKGYLAYTTDVSGDTQIVVRFVDTLQEITRVTVPGDIGFVPGIGNINWVDDNTLFVGVAREARLSPWLLTLSNGTWSGPLNDRSVIFSTCTSDGPVWVASSFSEPPCIHALRDGTVVTLLEPDHTGKYYAGESHWYISFDGRKIQGWLLRNEMAEAPLVVFCRGGIDAAVLSMWGTGIQEIVKAGYHVFAPNFRGSTTFGKEFKNLKCGDFGGGDLQDVLYGARYAANLLGTKGKPALVGGSYGGYLVLQALTVVPDEWAGGVAIVPIVDFVELYAQADPSYKTFIAHHFDGTLEEKPELYKDRSPITHIETLKSPVLLIAGENNLWCPPGLAKKFCEKAQRMNLPVFLEVLEGEDHGPARVSHAIRTAVLELEFLEALF